MLFFMHCNSLERVLVILFYVSDGSWTCLFPFITPVWIPCFSSWKSFLMFFAESLP